MALTFANTTDRDEVTSTAAISSLPAWTWLFWLQISTFTANRVIVRKRNIGHRITLFSTADLNISVARATTSTAYQTNSGLLSTLNKWYQLMVTFDIAAGAGLVHTALIGDLATALTACTFGTATDGSGAQLGDSGVNLGIRSQEGGGNSLQGVIAVAGYFNRVLTPGEGQDWLWYRNPKSGLILHHELGFQGTGTQIDYSGNGHAGTVTGATQSAHAPTRNPFSRRIRYVPVVSSGGSIASGAGQSQSDSTAVGAGASIASGLGGSLAASVAFAVGVAIFAGTGQSTSPSAAQATPAPIAAAVGESTSPSASAGGGASIAAGAGASSSPSTAFGSNDNVAQGDGASSSQSTATGAGAATGAGDGHSTSASGGMAVPAPLASGVGLSLGGSSAVGAGASIHAGAGAGLSQSIAFEPQTPISPQRSPTFVSPADSSTFVTAADSS